MKSIFKSLVLIPLILIGTPIFAADPVLCHCERYEGTTTQYVYNYHVGAGEGCCSGTPGVRATKTHNILNEGQWQFLSMVELPGVDAQTICCTPN